ncbi:hypothetical protein G7Y89_g6135 [Cudoniella acicularis]|uniref:Uncharacterized protein n=1 Tax=Cudoniella acicularis TaxID=354080 RepID=A0A8H4W5T9_9HELO|nr:hypothetical protein G7Y89_g6135 [Cudoniella acicularis]
MYSLIFIYTLLSLVRYAAADCNSYGIDYVNGGTYFIDNTQTTNFTFLTDFSGCDNEEITPILVDPNENEYFCSDIPTSPDYTSFLSTCPITQNQMFSGTWYIVIEGLTFAYVRTFTLTVGVPTTITETPTVTVGITSTPDAPQRKCLHQQDPQFCHLQLRRACQTRVFTSIVVPTPVFITSTYTISITITTGISWVESTSTNVLTASCTPPPYPRGADPKLQHAIYLPHMTITPPWRMKARTPDMKVHKARDVTFKQARNVHIVRRGPDSATVTVTETTSSATTTSTTVLAVPTVTETSVATTISTITPTPITTCHGVTMITTTKTLSQKTYTRLRLTDTFIFVEKTISQVCTMKSTTTPAVVATSCFYNGGSLDTYV